MVQLDDKVILGLAGLALAAYLYTIRSAGGAGRWLGGAATSIGAAGERAGATAYSDLKSVYSTGYKDTKSLAKSAAKQAKGFKSWVGRRF